MIDAETALFTLCYEGVAVERRGTGKVFPSVFTPPLTSGSADVFGLFPTTSVGRDQTMRFVYHNDPYKVLVYTDGACARNGQPNSRVGWAVVYGPNIRGTRSCSYMASG